MIRRRLWYGQFWLRLVTLLLPLCAFGLAAYMRFGSGLFTPRVSDIDPAAYFGLLLFSTIIWAVVTDHFSVCRFDELFASSGKTRRLLVACGFTYAGITTLTFFYREASFSRVFVFFSAVFLFGLAIVTRIAFRVLLDRSRRTGRNCVSVLIVGTNEFAQRVADSLLEGQVMPCRVAGFVRLEDQEVAVQGGRVYEIGEIPKLAVNNGIDEVVITLPPARLGEIRSLMTFLEPLCLPIRAILDLGEGVFIREKLLDFGGIMLLDLHSTPAESENYLILKRAFDIIFSLFVLVVTAPLVALIALAIKWTSSGPVLFGQQRVGLSGRLFNMYKFRTMHVGDPQESDTRWTQANDPRRTRLGTFLRRTNLDELPQFFNVLKGDMSVVGPRPERPYFVEKFLSVVARYNTRHYLKVGITGWAQVNGLRGDTPIAKRVEYDLYYLRNWSLTLDLQIILLTLLRGFRDKNAY